MCDYWQNMSKMPTPQGAYISRIPLEILSEIFVHCLPKDFASQNTQPLPLSSVCRLWRALVLATPALWASLDIICDPDVLRPPLHTIHTHLQRSGTYPLSFILRAVGSLIPPDRPNPNLLPVLTVLAAARQRWFNVHLDLFRMTQDIMDLITLGDAPLLQSIQCDVLVFEFQQSPPIPLCALLQYCPRLEVFHWRSSTPSPLHWQPFNGTRLTSFSLRAKLSVSECITLLRLSPRLSSAAFNGICSSGPSITPHLIHPTLRTLTAMGEYSGILLAALTLPRLLGLNLTIMRELTSIPAWDIILPAFLARSKPTLHRLSLSFNYAPRLEPVLLGILALTPYLSSLELSDCILAPPPFSAMLIRALHPLPPPGNPLCPRLRKLQLYGILGCPDGLCGAMLRARWGAQAHANGVTSLEWGHIEVEGGVHERDEADVEELRAAGMRVGFHVKN